MDEYFQGKSMSLQYKGTVMIGVMGIVAGKLVDLVPLIRKKYPSMEMAPVQAQPQYRRDFLAMFIDEPPRDITMVQADIKTSIVGFGLDRKVMMGTMNGIAKAIRFAPISLDDRTRKSWEMDFEREKEAYVLDEIISQKVKRPVEQVYGAMRYANLLRSYMGKSEEEAQRIACQRFELPI